MDIARLYHSILSDTEDSRKYFPYGSLVLGLLIILVSFIVFNRPDLSVLLSKKLSYPLLFGGLNQITSAFVHGSIYHLFSNMIHYFLVAPLIEKRIGTINFMILFFSGVILGGFTTFAKIDTTGFTSIGASSGVAALMLYFAIISFRRKIKIFNFIKIPGFLFLYPIISIAFQDYVLAQGNITRVNHWAHIGGYFAALFFYASFLTPKECIVNINFIKKNYRSYFLLALFPPL